MSHCYLLNASALAVNSWRHLVCRRHLSSPVAANESSMLKPNWAPFSICAYRSSFVQLLFDRFSKCHQKVNCLTMRIYSEESKKNVPAKSPLSPTLSTSSSSSCGITALPPNTNELEQSSYCGQISRVQIPNIFNKNRPNINMYKFISSKGKQITKESTNLGPNSYFVDNEYNEPKLPRYVASSHNFFRKRLSAIDKIQEELREMKQREDELKCQRVRTIGLSYPNLNSICDEDFTSDDQTIESSEENKDSFHSRCSSNPDLSINVREVIDATIDGDSALQVGGPRKKIPLIAMWEQRIQEVTSEKK